MPEFESWHMKWEAYFWKILGRPIHSKVVMWMRRTKIFQSAIRKLTNPFLCDTISTFPPPSNCRPRGLSFVTLRLRALRRLMAHESPGRRAPSANIYSLRSWCMPYRIYLSLASQEHEAIFARAAVCRQTKRNRQQTKHRLVRRLEISYGWQIVMIHNR